MAADGRSAMEKLSPPPVIHLSSSSSDSSGGGGGGGGDLDDYSAASDSDSDLGGGNIYRPPTKRQRMEGTSFGSSGNGQLLPDNFLDPLTPPKSSNVSPMLSFKKEEQTKWNDTEKCCLLKLLENYSGPKWRRRSKWTKEAWERIVRDFNNRSPKDNFSKTQLQDRVYQLKKTYGLLKKLSEISCLRWDHTSNMLQGPESAWKALIRTNKDAKQWYNKPCTYYSICLKLFEGKSTVENQSSGLKDCKESVTLSQPVKTSQQFDELRDIEEVSEPDMHPWSDLDDPSCQISSQKKDKTFEVPSDYFATSTGKPNSNLKFTGEFTDMRSDQCREAERLPSEREFSVKNCMEAFYKLDGFTREDVLKVGRIFKIMENREMFLSLRDDDKELWLRGEMVAFQL